MGRGTYRGASTLISPSGWIIGIDRARSTQARPPRTAVARLQSGEPQATARHSPDRNRELSFLHSIIHAELTGGPIPRIPKKARGKLEPKINKKGGVTQWAQAHPAYAEIRTKLMARVGDDADTT